MDIENIKTYRRNKKLTQAELGAICGVTGASVSRWESGKDTPSGSSLILLEKLINGEIIISNLTPMEAHLLDQNVSASIYADREEFLTESLRYLITHKKFLTLTESPSTAPLLKVAEPEAHYGSTIIDPITKSNNTGGEANTLRHGK